MSIQIKPLPQSNYSKGRTRAPWVIVLHYTAGFTEQHCWDVLNNRGISVHKCIERDGTIVEYVKDSDRAWHAGNSNWGGVSNINNHSLGIEIVNIGWGDGKFKGNSPYPIFDWNAKYPEDPEIKTDSEFRTWFRDETYRNSSGNIRNIRILTEQTMSKDLADHREKYKDKLWAIYPEEQVASTVEQVCRWMLDFNILPENIIGHEHISPGNKSDPGPAFPWKKFSKTLECRVGSVVPFLYDVDYDTYSRVKAVQSHCARLGLPVGDIDGIWGRKTQGTIEKAFELYSDIYQMDNLEIKKDNCIEISRNLILIPGFDPGRF